MTIRMLLGRQRVFEEPALREISMEKNGIASGE